MNGEWKQFPPIEGNSSSGFEVFALIASVLFAVGMIVYVMCL